MNGFLKEATLSSLKRLNPEVEAYYCDILSTLRKLAVYSEDASSSLQENGPAADIPAAGRTACFDRLDHQCIEEFFTPKKHTWYEDSRWTNIALHHEVSADMTSNYFLH
ncbi:hypothetical protein [Bacillus safensis FO-36b] [Bacillus safensis subsp. safensis]